MGSTILHKLTAHVDLYHTIHANVHHGLGEPLHLVDEGLVILRLHCMLKGRDVDETTAQAFAMIDKRHRVRLDA